MLTLLTAAALLEIGWTIYIGLELPRHYVANHWDLAWVGLDVAQMFMLICSAWAAWRDGRCLILFASVRGDVAPHRRVVRRHHGASR